MVFLSLTPWQIILIIVGGVLVSGLLFSIWFTFETARRVYINTLTKKCPDSWGRDCSAPNNPEQMKMWNEGLAWGVEQKPFIKDVQIHNDGLKLVGEFIDYGFDKTVIFLCGRCECLYYAYYYAAPYRELGYNVLVFDSRAHGYSDGDRSTAGLREQYDLIEWIKLLQNSYSQKEIALHCVCVGGATALLAYNNPLCPKIINRIILDGCFITFKESYLRHYIALNHPVFPVYYQIWFWFWWYTKCRASKSQPIKEIAQVDIPVLFLYGKQDIFSLPSKSELLIEKCPSKNKKVVWFETGSHSHLRVNNIEAYDLAVKEFIDEMRKQ